MEFDEIVVKESPGLCRCCLSEGCYKDMGSEYTWMNENEVYADMLLECFDIGISQHNDGPNGPNRLICEVCITRLRDACNFKKQVLDSEKKFVDMIGRGEFRPKVLIYQSQMKAEVTEVEDNTEVEYLEEDLGDYGDDDEPLRSAAPVAGAAPGKRGRPRKALAAADKRRKADDRPKTSKGVVKEEHGKTLQTQRRQELADLLRSILTGSTLMPFRWHAGKYMCFFCTAHFFEVSKLRGHVDTHTDFNNEIINNAVAKDHRIKLDVAQICCTVCEVGLPSFEAYIEHLDESHGERYDREVTGRLEVFSLNDEEMSCLECEETFKHFFQLLKHAHKDHTDVEKHHKFLCEICGQGFPEISSVQTHISQVHSVQRCKYCHESFRTCYALDKHVGTVHRIEKYQCPFCFKLLPNRYMRKRHLALVHDWESAQLRCDICDKIFTRNNKLLLHKRRVHMRERNVSCEECGVQFFDLEALEKHKKRHNDEKPFRCDLCKEAFRRNSELVVHVASCHGTGSK